MDQSLAPGAADLALQGLWQLCPQIQEVSTLSHTYLYWTSTGQHTGVSLNQYTFQGQDNWFLLSLED